MATVENSTTKLELIKDLPAKTSISATDLYLLQTSVQSYKVTQETLVSSLVDNSTIIVNGSNKLTVSNTVIQSAYPVGSIYMNASNASNPASLLGFGTWVAFGSGRVPVGIDAGQTEFDTAEETGGFKTHTLTNDESVLLSQSYVYNKGTSGSESTSIAKTGDSVQQRTASHQYDSSPTSSVNITNTLNSSIPHNNLQPYIVVHMWKRII